MWLEKRQTQASRDGGVDCVAWDNRPILGGKVFHFHWNRTSFVCNNSGDRVYLRHPDGRFATEPFPVP
jgi:hypothetical protein